MKRNFESKRKLILIGLILVAVIVIIIMAVSILGKGNKNNNEGSNAAVDNTNFVATPDGNKVNTSEEVAANKKVGKILLEKSRIVYENGMSKLTSKVTNDDVAKDNLRFTVKFIANDGSTISESVGFVGAIKENETKYIDSYITIDVSNAKDITYEIME